MIPVRRSAFLSPETSDRLGNKTAKAGGEHVAGLLAFFGAKHPEDRVGRAQKAQVQSLR